MKTETAVNLDFTEKSQGPGQKVFYQTVLVWCGHNWGRGKNLADAIKAAKVHPANEYNATVFTSNEPIEAWVTESGNYRYETETENAVVEQINLGAVKNWFAGDSAITELWQSLCAAIRERDINLSITFEDKTYRMLEKYIED